MQGKAILSGFLSGYNPRTDMTVNHMENKIDQSIHIMENNLSGKIPQTNLPKETELPENTDYRGIAGKGSLINDPKTPEHNQASSEEDNNEETDNNPLIRGI
jgi:hypothetical protein